MGSWGGSGFAALFGGVVTENAGWRWIFFASAAVSAVGMLMVRGTPESKAAADKDYRFDTMGVLTFMVSLVALQVIATQGNEIGWGGRGKAAAEVRRAQADDLGQPDRSR